jgi:hypothetical protein
MLISILILLVLVAVLAALTVYLFHDRGELNGQVMVADRQASAAKATREAAKRHADAAEQRCRELMQYCHELTAELHSSVSATGSALSIARQIQIVSQQLRHLTAYVFDGEEPRHALPDEIQQPLDGVPVQPIAIQYEHPYPPPRSLPPHRHVEHTRQYTREGTSYGA